MISNFDFLRHSFTYMSMFAFYMRKYLFVIFLIYSYLRTSLSFLFHYIVCFLCTFYNFIPDKNLSSKRNGI